MVNPLRSLKAAIVLSLNSANTPEKSIKKEGSTVFLKRLQQESVKPSIYWQDLG
jgi:hypothetical protein